jgi:hypothetical protein
MTSVTTDSTLRDEFPAPPIAGSALLAPIPSWAEMYRETLFTRVQFDLFWFDSVNDGVAYFFRWLGEPRCTVLVVWNDAGPTHIECRKVGDALASEREAALILAEVRMLFERERATPNDRRPLRIN